jgi:hypothetical protein
MGKYFQSRSPPGRLFFCRRFMPAGKMAYFDFCRSLGVICFTTSSVAENEEHDRRQRAPEERYPKPKPARSSARPSHLRGNRDRRKKTMKMKIDHASI